MKVLMAHEMETGQRKDAKGEIVPVHFIQSVVVTHNGKTVLDAQWSQAVSRDPFLGLRIKGAKAGDKITVTWTDNRGDKRTDESTVAEVAFGDRGDAERAIEAAAQALPGWRIVPQDGLPGNASQGPATELAVSQRASGRINAYVQRREQHALTGVTRGRNGKRHVRSASCSRWIAPCDTEPSLSQPRSA